MGAAWHRHLAPETEVVSTATGTALSTADQLVSTRASKTVPLGVVDPRLVVVVLPRSMNLDEWSNLLTSFTFARLSPSPAVNNRHTDN